MHTEGNSLHTKIETNAISYLGNVGHASTRVNTAKTWTWLHTAGYYRISKETPHTFVTKTNWLIISRQITLLYPENRTKPGNTSVGDVALLNMSNKLFSVLWWRGFPHTSHFSQCLNGVFHDLWLNTSSSVRSKSSNRRHCLFDVHTTYSLPSWFSLNDLRRLTS
jgi:hypothetical protein